MHTTETYRGYSFYCVQQPGELMTTRMCFDEDNIITFESTPASTAITQMLVYIDNLIDRKEQHPTEKVELNNKFVFGAYQCVYKQQPDGSWTGTLSASETSSYENFFVAPDVDKLFTMFNTWVHTRLNGH